MRFSLTELGKEQALVAHQYFQEQGIKFDKIYSSTQERACDTAELVTGRTDYTRLKGLKEQDFGAFEGQQEYLNPLSKEILATVITLSPLEESLIKMSDNEWSKPLGASWKKQTINLF